MNLTLMSTSILNEGSLNTMLLIIYPSLRQCFDMIASKQSHLDTNLCIPYRTA